MIKAVVLALTFMLVMSCSSQHLVTTQPTPIAFPQKLNKHSLIAPSLLKADIDFLVAKLEQIHPNPWANKSRTQFEDSVNQLLAGFRYPMTRREFFLQAAPLIAQLDDGHTFIEFPRDDISDYFFPLAVTIEVEQNMPRLYVAADLSGANRLPAGAEILSIANAPADYLIEKMSGLAAAETDTGKQRQVQLNFARYLSILGYEESDFRVTCLINGQRKQVQLEAMKLSDSTDSSVSFYGFSRLTDQTGLLWSNDFDEDPAKFKQFLVNTFARMERDQLQNLIVDLRFNHGGLTQNMISLLSFLTDQQLEWAKRGEMKVSEPLKMEYFSATRKLRKDNLIWGLSWLPLEWTDRMQRELFWADTGQLVEMPLAPVIPAMQHNMKNLGKRVWVVSNGYCYSACAFATAIINHYQLARVIGESVGSHVTEQFAFPVEVVLPHTGLKVKIATSRIETWLQTTDALPDLSVSRSQPDIEQKNDKALNQALREAELGVFR